MIVSLVQQITVLTTLAFVVQCCGNNQSDGQHVPMSLIRDEDRCCHINGILTLVSFLSLFVTIVCCWCCAFVQHCAVRISVSVASPSPLRGHWDCVLYLSECAHETVQVYYRRTSRFKQSCEPTDFCKAETIGGQQTTEPIRRHQKTESEG